MNRAFKRVSPFAKYINRLLIVLILLELALVGNIFLRSHPSILNSVAIATTVKPQPLTELYFADYRNLPQVILPGNIYTFTFAIHNLENRNMEYPYEVYLLVGNDKLLIDKKTALVMKNDSITISEEFGLNASLTKKQVIVVKLLNKNQQIDFLIHE